MTKEEAPLVRFNHTLLREDWTCSMQVDVHYCAIQRKDPDKWVRAKSIQSPERFLIYKQERPWDVPKIPEKKFMSFPPSSQQFI